MTRSLLTILLLTILAASTALADISPRLEQALSDPGGKMRKADGTHAVWVRFADRGLDTAALDAALSDANAKLSSRALERRARTKGLGEPLVSERDLEPAAHYVDGVAATGARLRHQSRWLNAASFDATDAQIAAIAALPFVAEVELVAVGMQRPIDTAEQRKLSDDEMAAAKAAGESRGSYNYGGSLPSAEQINIVPVHDLGLTGDGVVIGMLDSGFHTTHAALQHLDIVATWDFFHGDENVGYEEGQDEIPWQVDHGTKTLSVMTAFMDGEIVGSAFGASVILAKTEDLADEQPAEEDAWVAGIEWLESLGADVVTSSLGYYYWYDYADLDGNTALCTIAADLAVGHGVVVFNCAGNQRGSDDFPHLIVPADGDSVITVGATDVWGNLADFSSPGPTADGRTKPDVMANGVSAHCIADWNDSTYQGGTGTSFSTPLLAGVAALMLERLPDLTPWQIREALRETADNSIRPDDDFGWGVVDALAALNYYGPAIDHTTLGDTESTTGPYPVAASITSRVALDPAAMMLHWRTGGGAWQTSSLGSDGGDVFSATIPGQPAGTLVEYYIEAGDTDGIVLTSPLAAPTGVHAFSVIADMIAPTVSHVGLMTQTPGIWPPTVRATATDNIGIADLELTYQLNGGGVMGPYPLVLVGDQWQVTFPLASVQVGDAFTYEITATDASAAGNTAVAGPYPVAVQANLGSVLVIDNDLGSVPALEADGSGDVQDIALDVAGSADLIAGWLTMSGYDVTEIAYNMLTDGDVVGHDALVLSGGSNGAAAASSNTRNVLVNWVRGGGRVLVEGGEIAYPAMEHPRYPEFAAEVLHIDAFYGDWVYDFPINQAIVDHPFLQRPHRLPEMLDVIEPGPYYTNISDVVLGSAGTEIPYRTIWNGATGAVVTWDDNSAVEAGQTVYITVDVAYLDDTAGRELLANSLSYLLAPEPPGGAVIAGTVSLADGADPAGTVVSCRYGDATTDADGNYEITGVWGGSIRLSVVRDGYAPLAVTVEIADDEYLGGQDFVLFPVSEVTYSEQADLPIPDYDPVGVTSVISVVEAGDLLGISVDIDISHNYIGNLEVSLTSPAGTTVMLHDNSGSSADDILGNWPETLSVDGPGLLEDFHGEDVQGDWTLRVADTNYAVWGTLNAWGVNLLVAQQVTAVEAGDLPLATRLVGNFPNPFNPQTMVAFELPRSGHVRLDIHDVRGRLVRRLSDGGFAAGRHEVRWDGRGGDGRNLASGLYFVRLVAAGETQVHKMTLVR